MKRYWIIILLIHRKKPTTVMSSMSLRRHCICTAIINCIKMSKKFFDLISVYIYINLNWTTKIVNSLGFLYSMICLNGENL